MALSAGIHVTKPPLYRLYLISSPIQEQVRQLYEHFQRVCQLGVLVLDHSNQRSEVRPILSILDWR